MQFLKWILTEIQGKSLFKPIEKTQRQIFEFKHKKTKMPLGAKLTKNDSDAILKCFFNRKLKQELIQTKLQDSETILRV